MLVLLLLGIAEQVAPLELTVGVDAQLLVEVLCVVVVEVLFEYLAELCIEMLEFDRFFFVLLEN
jgi:hypothetical protein